MLRQAAQASCSQLSPSLWCIPARGASAAPWHVCPGLGWPIPMLNPNLPWLSLSSNQSSTAPSLSPCHQWWLQQRLWRSKETMQRPLPQNSGQRQTWESCKRRPWRRSNLNTCCSGKWTIELQTLRWCGLCCSRPDAEVGDGAFLYVRYQPGCEPKTKQSWASTQRGWVGPVAMRRTAACFFLSESILKASPQHTHSEIVSLWLTIMQENVIFPFWTSDNIKY